MGRILFDSKASSNLQQHPSDVVSLTKQKVLIFTGEYDNKASLWNEKCTCVVWKKARAVVVCPLTLLEASEGFPIQDQANLTRALDKELKKNGNIPCLTPSRKLILLRSLSAFVRRSLGCFVSAVSKQDAQFVS